MAIALRAARDGANITIAAKTAEPNSKLPGTIYTAAKEIEEAGGQALPCIVDIRDDDKVQKALDKTCLLYTSPSPRDLAVSRMPSSA